MSQTSEPVTPASPGRDEAMSDESSDNVPSTMTIIKWNGRRYLVPKYLSRAMYLELSKASAAKMSIENYGWVSAENLDVSFISFYE